MVTRSTIRYAAKQAYQLCLIRGLDHSTQCGMECKVIHPNVYVLDCSQGEGKAQCHEVPIAKAWANL